jgi:hypothetical protein
MKSEITKLAARTGLPIPKPEAKADFTIKCIGRRRCEEALIYRIPSHTEKSSFYEKGVTLKESEQAFKQLSTTGYFTRSWFNKDMSNCAKEGGCNFTTIGGVFILLGHAQYSERGIYQYKACQTQAKPSCAPHRLNRYIFMISTEFYV